MKRLALVIALALASCGPPKGIPVEEVLSHLEEYRGRSVPILMKLRSGARCRQGEDGEWKTYCKDCVYCRGPLVADLGTVTSTSVELDDWPLILGGTVDFEDIRCKGPLDKVVCAPMQAGKTYVIQGVIEFQRPPKLLVERFWPVE
jgi:hypothetical protein